MTGQTDDFVLAGAIGNNPEQIRIKMSFRYDSGQVIPVSGRVIYTRAGVLIRRYRLNNGFQRNINE